MMNKISIKTCRKIIFIRRLRRRDHQRMSPSFKLPKVYLQGLLKKSIHYKISQSRKKRRKPQWVCLQPAVNHWTRGPFSILTKLVLQLQVNRSQSLSKLRSRCQSKKPRFWKRHRKSKLVDPWKCVKILMSQVVRHWLSSIRMLITPIILVLIKLLQTKI